MEKTTTEGAILLLRNNINAIHTVGEWAEEAGYSRSYFSTLIQRELGKPPYRIICREKYQKIRQLVRNNPGCKGVIIARRTGFSDMKALYKFLKNHFDTTLTTLRRKARTGDEGQIEQIR